MGKGANRTERKKSTRKTSRVGYWGEEKAAEVGCVSSLLGSLQRRRRRQRGRQKNNKFITQTTTLHVHHAFLYISSPSLHDYDVKMPNCKFYGGRKQVLFLSLNLSAVLKKSTPGKFAYTCHFQQIGINATKTEKNGNSF